jgi:hypothetical protein
MRKFVVVVADVAVVKKRLVVMQFHPIAKERCPLE